MPELYLDVADRPQPQHLLRACPRRKMMIAKAEAAAIDAHTLTYTSVSVDGQVHNLHHARVILVGSKARCAVQMGMQLAIHK